MTNNSDKCEICNKPYSDCDCHEICEHTCALDFGEEYCPVCRPEIKSDGK